MSIVEYKKICTARAVLYSLPIIRISTVGIMYTLFLILLIRGLCTQSYLTSPYWVANDDYCDSIDGSDEFNTSACSHTLSSYHKCNIGGSHIKLPASRVHDGICDCCDGSDELGNNLQSSIVCEYTCEKSLLSMRREALVMHRNIQAG